MRVTIMPRPTCRRRIQAQGGILKRLQRSNITGLPSYFRRRRLEEELDFLARNDVANVLGAAAMAERGPSSSSKRRRGAALLPRLIAASIWIRRPRRRSCSETHAHVPRDRQTHTARRMPKANTASLMSGSTLARARRGVSKNDSSSSLGAADRYRAQSIRRWRILSPDCSLHRLARS